MRPAAGDTRRSGRYDLSVSQPENQARLATCSVRVRHVPIWARTVPGIGVGPPPKVEMQETLVSFSGQSTPLRYISVQIWAVFIMANCLSSCIMCLNKSKDFGQFFCKRCRDHSLMMSVTKASFSLTKKNCPSNCQHIFSF